VPDIDARLAELGITLPDPFPPAGNYVSSTLTGDLLFVGGHGPVDGSTMILGKVGADLTLEQGREAARMTGLSLLATMRADLGSLDRVEQIVKVFGMVNIGGSFDRMPAVIDGCSDLLVEVFGDKGRHTRSAVGMAALPFGIAVEIELIARVA
jgi:enamine deaminase RidA (YjgF/YER057c/UK114 family)